MHLVKKRNHITLALLGQAASPKLYSALQLAYGLCGNWNRIIVIGSSSCDTIYQRMGSYSMLSIPHDASPQRYSDLLNLCGSCKDVVIFSSLSDEWTSGVTAHQGSSYYTDVLKDHQQLMTHIRSCPIHVIACIDTKRKFGYSTKGITRLQFTEQVVQQEDIEQHFATAVRLDKKGRAKVEKDLTGMLPQTPFLPNQQSGALLQDWCCEGRPVVTRELQQKIDACNSLSELYQLLFDLEVEDVEIITAFAKRRVELDLENNIERAFPPLDVDLELLNSYQP